MTAPTAPLHGRTVLVTGGSRRIGAAIVRAAHRDGATVLLHYGNAAAAAQAIAHEVKDRIHLVCGDLSDPDGSEAIWSASLDLAGRIDVVVNNAGAWIPSPLESIDGELGWD